MKLLYDETIQSAVARYLPGYDWRLYKAQLWEESKLNPRAVSPAGAGGLAQFMPATWEDWSPRAGFEGSSRFDAEASIFTGACYMSWLREQWSWDRPDEDRYCLMLASYNSGLGDVLVAQKLSGMKSLYSEIIAHLHEAEPDHAEEAICYVRRVMAYWIDHVSQGRYESR